MSSASREQGHNGFNLSWKLCLSLCSLRWLKTTRRRVNNFKPETSLVPKALFAVGRIKSKTESDIVTETPYVETYMCTFQVHMVKSNKT